MIGTSIRLPGRSGETQVTAREHGLELGTGNRPEDTAGFGCRGWRRRLVARIAGGALLLAGVAGAAAAQSAPVCVTPDGTRVRLDLAIKDEERFLGLMFRDSLPADNGMLFIFPADDRHPFWMKNTFIPLDLIWLDAAGAVVEVRADVQPCRSDPCPSYVPTKPGRAVLEVNAGFARQHSLAPGVVLRWEGIPDYPLKGEKK